MIEVIHQELENLKSNLEEIDAAKKQVQKAGKIATDVTKKVDLLVKQHETMLQTTREEINTLKEKVLEQQSGSIDKTRDILSGLTFSVINSIENKVQKDRVQFGKLFSSYEELVSKHKDSVDGTQIILSEFTKTLSVDIQNKTEESLKSINTLVSDHHNTSVDIITTLNRQLKIYDELADASNELIRDIQEIDFPNRLEVIDDSIKNINSGLQNSQNTVNRVSNKIANIDNQLLQVKGEVLQTISKSNYQLTEKMDGYTTSVLAEQKKVNPYMIGLIITQVISLIFLVLIMSGAIVLC